MLDYQVQVELYKKLEIQVVAASVDSLETSVELVKSLGLTFPVGYGLDANAISSLIGAYYEESPLYLHATGFLLNPAGKVFDAVYSSRSIGRLTPQDVASLIEIVRSREKQ